MRVHFHGAAGEVTGSMHEVETAGQRLLLDCGMVQGSPEAEARNAAPFPFDPAAIDAVVLSHAHIDHIGRVPLLVARGFRGPIFATAATAALMPVMLLDSASLAEADAERANRDRRPGEPRAVPLYDRDDVEATMRLVRPMEYDARTEVLPGIELALREAGHILGSAVVELWADGRKLVFSGDLGPRGAPILRDPAILTGADLVLMESTYGDRDHRDRGSTVQELGGIFDQAWRDRGNVLVPAFAVGRTQEFLYWFARHWEQWQLARWRIFLDSPMAVNATRIFHEHLGEHRLTTEQCNETFSVATFVRETEESKKLNTNPMPKIIISASGMATGGRILHHLKNYASDRRSSIMLAGFQAGGTRGAALRDGATEVKIHGGYVPVRAEVVSLDMFSAHADREELLRWLGGFESAPRETFVIHGEPSASDALRHCIDEKLGWTVRVPEHQQTVELK